MIISGFSFIIMHSAAKYLSDEVHVFEITFLRCVLVIFVLAPLIFKQGLNTLITYVCTFIINIQLKQDKIMGELNTKSQKITFIIQCSVKSDANEFRKWANDRAAKYVFDLKEVKTISYEWYLSDDNKEATLVESFIDSDGAMQRLNNHMSSPIAEEVMQHVDIKKWLVFGNSKQDLIDTLTPFGASFNRHHCGFNHSSE